MDTNENELPFTLLKYSRLTGGPTYSTKEQFYTTPSYSTLPYG